MAYISMTNRCGLVTHSVLCAMYGKQVGESVKGVIFVAPHSKSVTTLEKNWNLFDNIGKTLEKVLKVSNCDHLAKIG